MTPVTLAVRPYPVVATPRVHYVWLGTTQMFCIQPNCDGVHHFYCGCGARAHAH